MIIIQPSQPKSKELNEILGCISHLKAGTLKAVINSRVQSSGGLSITLAIPP